jgi:hypothetical protein
MQVMYLVQVRKPWGPYYDIAWTDDLSQAHQIGQREVLRFAVDSDLSHSQIGYLIVYLAPGGAVRYIPALNKPWEWCDRILKNGRPDDEDEPDRICSEPGRNQASHHEGTRERAGKVPQEVAWWSLGD